MASRNEDEKSPLSEDDWKDILGEGHEKMTLDDILSDKGESHNTDNILPPQMVANDTNNLLPPQKVANYTTMQMGGRGERRVVVEPLDEATLKKEKRRIKNRESAARSRERKQAYLAELESTVARLEAENADLRKEELMEGIIPVEEKSKERRKLRRVSSAEF